MIQPAEVTNDALLDAIRAVQREDTPPRRTLLYQLLLDSTLLVPMQPGKDAGPPTIRGASDEHGSWFPAFTSLDAMRRWSEGTGLCAAASARDVFLTAEQGDVGRVVIDPGSPEQGVIDRREITSLARGRLPIAPATDHVAPDTTLTMRPPQGPLPEDTLATLHALLEPHAEVRRALVTWLGVGDGAPDLTVALCPRPSTPEATMDAVVRRIADTAAPPEPSDRPWSFIAATPELEQQLAAGGGTEVFVRA